MTNEDATPKTGAEPKTNISEENGTQTNAVQLSCGERVRGVISRYVPLPVFFILMFGIVTAAVHLGSVLSPSFADGINDTVAAALRWLLAKITNIFPFSVGETLLFVLPFVLAGLVYIGIRRAKDKTLFIRYMAAVLSVLVVLYALFVFTIGCGYHGKTLDKKLGMTLYKSSVSDLYSTADELLLKTNALAEQVYASPDGDTVMPYSYGELNDKLIAAYDAVRTEYPFIQNMYTRVKPVSVSHFMAYTHITGVYSYMTGEANINNVFPDYTIPFTAAHELAHQRGIARENEANFVAFLVCIASDDVYIQYSGYMNMLEYVGNALYSASPDEYTRLAKGYSSTVRNEMMAYHRFFEKYEDSVVGEISGTINNTYLQLQGTPGTRSYGMVVDLAVSYFKEHA